MNKHTIMKDFVSQFLTDGRYLYFESIDLYAGFRGFVPEYGDAIINQDITGSIQKQYTFAFVGVELFDKGTSNQNELNMKLFDDFYDWIIEKNKNEEYPDFGEGITEKKLLPLYNMANLSQIDENMGLAKYVLMCRYEYTEKG